MAEEAEAPTTELQEEEEGEAEKEEAQEPPVAEVDELRERITALFQREDPILQKLSSPGAGNAESWEKAQELFDEFYEFCQETLKSAPQFEESVFFVSLFYYFLEQKAYVKEEGIDRAAL
jgi:hypothetical protein